MTDWKKILLKQHKNLDWNSYCHAHWDFPIGSSSPTHDILNKKIKPWKCRRYLAFNCQKKICSLCKSNIFTTSVSDTMDVIVLILSFCLSVSVYMIMSHSSYRTDQCTGLNFSMEKTVPYNPPPFGIENFFIFQGRPHLIQGTMRKITNRVLHR